MNVIGLKAKGGQQHGMSYVDEILRPNERVLGEGNLHWILYMPGMVCLILAVLAPIYLERQSGLAAALILGLFGVLLLLRDWIIRRTTEIAVTDYRVIYKTGLIRRRTA